MIKDIGAHFPNLFTLIKVLEMDSLSWCGDVAVAYDKMVVSAMHYVLEYNTKLLKNKNKINFKDLNSDELNKLAEKITNEIDKELAPELAHVKQQIENFINEIRDSY